MRILQCPRCKELRDMTHSALSRRADIKICSSCGTREAIEDMMKREPYLKWLEGRVENVETSMDED